MKTGFSCSTASPGDSKQGHGTLSYILLLNSLLLQPPTPLPLSAFCSGAGYSVPAKQALFCQLNASQPASLPSNPIKQIFFLAKKGRRIRGSENLSQPARQLYSACPRLLLLPLLPIFFFFAVRPPQGLIVYGSEHEEEEDEEGGSFSAGEEI